MPPRCCRGDDPQPGVNGCTDCLGRAEYFQDLKEDFLPSLYVFSQVDFIFGSLLMYLAPFLVYFSLASFFAASIIQAFYVLNHRHLARRICSSHRQKSVRTLF